MLSYVIIVIAYFIGSIPFGLLLSKLAGVEDIRKHGSGNIGATNVLRVAGKKLAILTLFADGLKGAIIVSIAKYIGFEENIMLATAASSVIGHIFPIFLGFKGGKGVATAIATLSIVSWQIGIFILATWLVVFLMTRISSLSAILAFAFSPIFTFIYFSEKNIFYLVSFLSLLIIYRHKTNIMRLIKGEEKRSSFAK
jgi:glycerol-3-phosphate acyltransferase PlsY